MCDRDRLILDNLKLARWHASRRKYHGPAVCYDDLYQAACIGLIKAADTWEPCQASFGAWATIKIRIEIQMELNRMLRPIRVPRGQPRPGWEPLGDDVEQEPREPHIEIAEQAEALLSRLSHRTREMMRLHVGLDWPATQIAEAFYCSHTTVDNRVRQAIELIRMTQQVKSGTI